MGPRSATRRRCRCRSLLARGRRLRACSRARTAAAARAEPRQRLEAADKPIEDEHYDGADAAATGPAGMKALERWLERNVRGESWGIIRCERLKARQLQPPLRGPGDRLAPRRRRRQGATRGDAPDRTLLATDRQGNPRARPPDGHPGADLRLPRLVGGDGGTRRLQLLLSSETASCATTSTAPRRTATTSTSSSTGTARASRPRSGTARWRDDPARVDRRCSRSSPRCSRSPAPRSPRSAKRMHSTKLGPTPCETTGGGKFVAIPGFPGEMIDRRLLADIRWLEALPDLHHRRLLDETTSIPRRASTRSGWRSTSSPTRRPAAPGTTSTGSPRWAEPQQNRPRAPFRWVGYNGDAGHGRGHHLHLSWGHSTPSPGGRRSGPDGALPGRATSAADGWGARGRSAHRRHRGPPRRRLAEAAAHRRWSRPAASASAIRAP